jgi:hypothetical protein
MNSENRSIDRYVSGSYRAFFGLLREMKVAEFEEKPFTLQDYFMSFYKEEKKFAGLSGVEGNAK